MILSEATIDALVQELRRRSAATVILIENDDPDKRDFYYSGGVSRAIGVMDWGREQLKLKRDGLSK